VKEKQMRDVSFQGLAAIAAGCVLSLAGCGGADLGECDMAALGGSADRMAPAPHAGQVLVNASCAAGRCHSADAAGDTRVGAPADLNFDVVPQNTMFEELGKVQDGAAVVQDERENMWALIDSGEMPPKPPAGSGEMSAANKDVVRNWLACGAPVIATPAAAGPHDDAWTAIYTSLSSMGCQGCHGPGSAMGSFLPAPGDACAAYDLVVGVAASGPMCGNSAMMLVQPSNVAGSLLLQKLRGTQTCGGPMPMGAANPLAVDNPTLVDMIEQWIMDGALEPESCR
jgi:hypothetical protein